MLIKNEYHDIKTKTGLMRTYHYLPDNEADYPCIIFYSEIFQQTAPIARAASILASHGFHVLVPEVFHELNAIGTILAYDDIGKNKGNQDKFSKPLEAHDSDTEALIAFAKSIENFNGMLGTMGVCIGGHLAYRAALNPAITASYCLYPTDIHSNTLTANNGNNSLERIKDIEGEIHFVFGRQDPHVPIEGRLALYQACQRSGINFEWQEVNAQHAFMRDEGERYDAALALQMYQNAIALFNRTLR